MTFTAHIIVLRRLELESNSKLLEIGLIVICAAVHFFAPFNMAEGQSRYRYAVAYSVEAIEIVVLLNMTVGYEHCTLPYKEYIMTGTLLDNPTF
ncbi:unnamed protein product [Onchocerca flexuosa]|uniref:XK-related protein n=1 Tax=Onchocerca flexuosa TaxID=387005 RepID=A0A183H5F0_9BILA|nr:unnamed protein product [Onchocerca flexuosa]